MPDHLIEEATTPTGKRRPIFYGWHLVGLSAVVMALLSGPGLHGLPVWTIVLRQRFGWSPSQLALGYSMQRAESSVLGPIAGYLTDRLGTRRIVPIGLVIFGTGFIVFSQVHELWQFYLSFVIISMGTGLGGWLALMTMLNSWFVRRKSLAMGISLEGLWIGGAAIVPALAWSVDPDKYGLERWRDVALLLGVVVILLAVPIGYLLRNRPEDKSEIPDGRGSQNKAMEGRSGPSRTDSRSHEEPQGLSLRMALQTRAFWIIAFGHALSTMPLTTFLVHMGLLLDDRGLSVSEVGLVTGVMTLTAAALTPVGGIMGDRFPVRKILPLFSVVQMAGLYLAVWDSSSLYVTMAFAALIGIGWGARAAPTSSVRGTYFGRRSFAKITGFSMMPLSLMSLVSPWIVGRIYQLQGESYRDSFLVLATIGLVGSMLFIFLGNPEATLSKSEPVPSGPDATQSPA